MPFKALIVGGGGDMGRWCAMLLKRAGFQVSISSRRDVGATAASMGVGIASLEDAGKFDVVVLSVPIDSVEDVSAHVGPLLKPGSLLMDVSSLKSGPVALMLEYTSPEVEVIGAHPLFGPGLESLEGRTIVLVPTERCERWLSIIKDVFESIGASIVLSTPEDHDRRMAIVQGLTHYMYLCWGRTIERLGVNVSDLDAYRTPIFSITKDMAGRLFSRNPGMYALIQSGPDVRPVRRAFIESCEEISALIDTGNTEGFAGMFSSIAANYGDTEGAKARSDRLVRLEQEESATIKRSTGMERAFSLAGGRKIYGVIKEARRDDFVLETPSETLVLRYDSVTPLEQESLRGLKDGSPRIGRDILVKMPIGADARVMSWALSKIEGVIGVRHETHDAMSPDFVVHRFAVDVQSGQSEETLQRVLATIWGLGYEVK
ncbi:MAG TPA: prephenate dehydrogenase/arogenate dehydrogenase family protein [Methanocella sp.]|nr:prephenate dehydrogenase/arogenate dehydrogenase family protein [Methanocella sp.]